MADRLAAALAAWAPDPVAARTAAVYAALLDASLLLPVRATVVTGEAAQVTGPSAEKEAELAVLTVDLGDGRTVLPLFTSPELMRRWRIEARPVATTVSEACRAALDEGWSGIIVDPGSHDFPLGTATMRSLARGVLPLAGNGSVPLGAVSVTGLPADAGEPAAAVVAALRRAVARAPAVSQAWLTRVAGA